MQLSRQSAGKNRLFPADVIFKCQQPTAWLTARVCRWQVYTHESADN